MPSRPRYLAQPLPPAAIELVALTKRYAQGSPAVDSINLRIASGSYCCLLGPSGCGKSTTLRMIAGHESVTSGDILLDNRNITNLPAAEPRHGHDVPELCAVSAPVGARQRGLQPEDEGHWQGRAPRPAPRTCWSAWPWAHLAERKPAELSGGQQQRVALARALITQPQRAAARRAAVGAGPLFAHPDARRAAPLAKGAGPDLHPRHPFAGRSDGAGRHHGGDEPRPDRAGRLAARGLQPPGQRIRRALHGRPQRAGHAGRQDRRAHRPHAAHARQPGSARRPAQPARRRHRCRVPGHLCAAGPAKPGRLQSARPRTPRPSCR